MMPISARAHCALLLALMLSIMLLCTALPILGAQRGLA